MKNYDCQEQHIIFHEDKELFIKKGMGDNVRIHVQYN